MSKNFSFAAFAALLLLMSVDLNHFCAACQLHHSIYCLYFCLSTHISNLKKVEDIGVEPMTPCVQGRCSSQLS